MTSLIDLAAKLISKQQLEEAVQNHSSKHAPLEDHKELIKHGFKPSSVVGKRTVYRHAELNQEIIHKPAGYKHNYTVHDWHGYSKANKESGKGTKDMSNPSSVSYSGHDTVHDAISQAKKNAQ